MVGRGMRKHPLKTQGCLVVDFTDSGGKHDITQVCVFVCLCADD